MRIYVNNELRLSYARKSECKHLLDVICTSSLGSYIYTLAWHAALRQYLRIVEEHM